MRTPYSVLLQAGFTLRAASPKPRWALTPPFHPYPGPASRAVCFLWHFPSACAGWTLSTALSPWSPDFPPASKLASDCPAVWSGGYSRYWLKSPAPCPDDCIVGGRSVCSLETKDMIREHKNGPQTQAERSVSSSAGHAGSDERLLTRSPMKAQMLPSARAMLNRSLQP